MKISKLLLIITCAISSFSTIQASAEDIDISLPITAATVHPYSAVVTRSLDVQLPAGQHNLRIINLPSDLDPSRLLLSIANDSVRLGSIDIDESTTGESTSTLELQLREELQELIDRREVFLDDIETANSELLFLNSLATGGGDASVKPSVNADELSNLLSTMSTSANQARARIREARLETRNINVETRAKEFELSQIATRRIISSTVTAQLIISNEVEVTVSLSYPEENAEWSWLYEARLDTNSQELGFYRQAVVSQYSGEQWDQIELTLTTADVLINTDTPTLESIFVDIYEPVDLNLLRNRAQFNNNDIQVLQEITVTGSRARATPADIQASQYLVDYRIPGNTTVESDQQEKIIMVDENVFNVSLVARAVPSIETSAYLEARFVYDGDIPFQSAPAQLYRDGAFIGDSYFEAFLPGQDVSLPFGVDELFRIELFNEEEESRTASVLRRSNFEDSRLRFEVSNFHSSMVPIEIISQVPVSSNARINVEISDDATIADVVDAEGIEGMLMWKLEINPGETEAIQHYFSISYPKDTELDYQ